MNLYIVLCRTKKKFDKYVKINRIRNKVIIDIKNQLEENDLDYDEFKDYFNIIIFTKIIHAFKKGKDVYYIPNFDNDIDLNEIFKLSSVINNMKLDFNLLFFHDDFKDNYINNLVIENIDKFTTSQIIKDY